MRSKTNGRPVTKSVRLSSDESDFLAEVSAREHLAEGTLIRKSVLDALERSRLDLAIADYSTGTLNLGEAAARARVSVGQMMAELDARGIDTISVTHFRTSLSNLTDLFGASDELSAGLAERET